jgi:hypothetical protein
VKSPALSLLKKLQAATAVLGVLAFGLVSAPASFAAAPALTGGTLHDVCSASHPRQMACTAILNRNAGMKPLTTTETPDGYWPADLRAAYNIPKLASAGGRTVAVVVGFDAPTLEADLGTYRARFGLPSCTSANGCFKKVNQSGQASPLPAVNAGWAQEASLDVDMVSAACPGCHILVVEANSDYSDDLGPSVNTAVTLGAVAVNNSYGGDEVSGLDSFDPYYTHPGVTITVAAGDSGYRVQYPASVPAVTAVGGTSLTYTGPGTGTGAGRAWTESAWGAPGSTSGTGSGCSAYAAKPAWQTDTGCTNRAVADVSAVADPQTGVAVYDSTPDSGGDKGWLVMGGTSAAAPFIAGLSALAGKATAGTDPASYAYAVPSALNDVTSGSTGVCAPVYLCSGAGGYDGPTGLGTPNGLGALTDLKTAFAVMQSAPANASIGTPSGQVTCAADGGCSQMYSDGAGYWSPATGAHAVRTFIRTRWNQLGGTGGRAGYPLAEQVDGLVNGGSAQQFQGATIYWSPVTDAHLSTPGAIRNLWISTKSEGGRLGYPTSDEISGLRNGGVYQTYQGGTVYWSPSTGAHISTGGIRSVWLKFGAQNGAMGYPTSEEITGLVNGGVYQSYQGGAIYWSPKTGAHITTGGIRAAWGRFGYEHGKMGYPTSDENYNLRDGGVYQTYQGGAIYWSPATGAHISTGGIRSAWGRLGYENGRLGYPTSDEYAISGGVRQTYQGGYIDYSYRYGVQVHLR